jgi:hypothetical protein
LNAESRSRKYARIDSDPIASVERDHELIAVLDEIDGGLDLRGLVLAGPCFETERNRECFSPNCVVEHAVDLQVEHRMRNLRARDRAGGDRIGRLSLGSRADS